MTGDVDPPFAADGELEELEKALIRAVEAGGTFRPAPSEPRPGAFVRGELIRAILLGSPLRHHPGPAPGAKGRLVRVTGQGIRIAPEKTAPKEKPAAEAGTVPPPTLRISGQVDLRGLSAPEGGCLPPLEFDRCVFDRPILLDGAHIQSLTLRASRFSRLSAKGASFRGDVVVKGCGPRSGPRDPGERHFAAYHLAVLETVPGADPAEPDSYCSLWPAGSEPLRPAEPCSCKQCDPASQGSVANCGLCCTLDLHSARIGGGLSISESYLRAADIVGRDYVTPRVRDKVAINLRGAQIGDSVKIVQSFTIGAVSAASAEVDDDFWVWGGKFFASAERPTFDFQLATIGGLLAFRAQRAGKEDAELKVRAFPVVVIGQISAIGLTAGEVWISEGFYFGHDTDKRGSFPTLNFAKSDIRGTFKVGAYHDYQVLDPERPTAAAAVHGDICAVAANIGKNFELLGLRHEGIRETLGAHDRFFDWFGVDRDEIPHLKLTAQGLKVDRRAYIAHSRFRDADVPTEDAATTRPKNSAPAAIDFWKSTIGTGFRIDHHSRSVGALRLNSCVIGRELVVGCRKIERSAADPAAADFKPGDIPLLVDISESTINGRLRIGRHEPRSEGDKDAIEVEGAISLQSSRVQGGILLGHLTFDLHDYESSQPDPAAATALNRTALDLRDCTCGADLEIHALRWKLPPLPDDRRLAIRPAPRNLWAWVGHRHRDRFEGIESGSYAEIDLRGLQCGMLIDGFGDEWDLIPRLRIRLAGMRIGEVEPASHVPPHPRAGPDEQNGSQPRPRPPDEARLNWLAFQNRVQEVVDQPCSPGRADPAAGAPQAAPPSWRPISRIECAGNRFWIRHYCSRDEDFVPQAYNAFSSAYRRSGEDSIAEAILVEKKNIQNALRFRRLREFWRLNVWGTRRRRPAGAGTSAPRRLPLPSPAAAWPILLVGAVLLWIATWMLGIHGPSSAMAIGGIVLVILVWPFLVAAFQMIFRWGFRYGLSPNSALFVLFLFICAGWILVHVARNGGLAVRTFPPSGSTTHLDPAVALVLDVDYEPVPDPPPEPKIPDPPDDPKIDGPAKPPCGEGAAPAAAPARPVASPSSPAPPAEVPRPDRATARPLRETGHAIHVRASPCDLSVNSLLYAVDIFLPLIDLDQERRCTIREAEPPAPDEEPHDDYAGWRLAKALYELLGWIITSLVILTITGVLRRDLER